jgi:hypothetical protein
MIFHMKTTLLIPDSLFRDLKRRAAERGAKLSNITAELLRRGLAPQSGSKRLPPLPSFDTGPARIDIADRDALYRALEKD